MSYKLVVSHSPVRVGIPGSLNITDNSPWLTLAQALVSVSSSDSSTGSDTQSETIAVSSLDSSVESEIQNSPTVAVSDTQVITGTDAVVTTGDQNFDTESIHIAENTATTVAVNDTDSIHFSENTSLVANGLVSADSSLGTETQSLSTANQISDVDSSVSADSTVSLFTNIPVNELSVSGESSSLVIATTDSIVGSDSGLTGLFPSDVDAGHQAETQVLASGVVSSDQVTGSENQNITLFFSSSDSVICSETNDPIADAVLSIDSGTGTEFAVIIPDFQDLDYVILAESNSLIVQVSDQEMVAGTDSQPLNFNDSDSGSVYDQESFRVLVVDIDTGALQSENVAFGIQTQVTMQWSVFAHLNQVVFAQPLS